MQMNNTKTDKCPYCFNSKPDFWCFDSFGQQRTKGCYERQIEQLQDHKENLERMMENNVRSAITMTKCEIARDLLGKSALDSHKRTSTWVKEFVRELFCPEIKQ